MGDKHHPALSPAFSLVYNTGKSAEKEQFLFACRGAFNPAITDNILHLTESNLGFLDTSKVAKKVYYLMVEGLQNITRHQVLLEDKGPYDGGLFIIQRKPEAYSITYGNKVSAKTRGFLQERLDEIVTKDPAELKEYYLETLNNSGFSTKGGAGLGLIDMARKSSSSLHFDFHEIEDGYFYYLNLTISLEKEVFSEDVYTSFLNDAKKIHHDLIDCNAELLFKGLLNEDNVDHISTHIDTTLSEDKENEGLAMVMTELLKNVAKHAYSRFNTSGNAGVFLLSKSDDGLFKMTTGNFIHARKEESVHKVVEAINELTTDELNEYLDYRVSEKRAMSGQGLLKLRKIAGHGFEYRIIDAETHPPFFILETKLKG